jgi:AhpD family alkylhydroperoxidase
MFRKEWVEFDRIAPGVSDAISALGGFVKQSGLDLELLELVKIRASQINGCAYCTRLHLNVARKLGMVPERLDLLAVWREAEIYSERERIALAWTERLTNLSQSEVTDEAYAEIHAHFSEVEVAALTSAIVEINAWNRLGATYCMSPPIPRREKAVTSGNGSDG